MVSHARRQICYDWDKEQLDLLITSQTHFHLSWMSPKYGPFNARPLGVLCNCPDDVIPMDEIARSEDGCFALFTRYPDLVKPLPDLDTKFHPLITPLTHKHTAWTPLTYLFSHPMWPFHGRPEDLLRDDESHTMYCNQTGEKCRAARPYDGGRNAVNELFHVEEHTGEVVWKPHPRLFWAARTISRAWKRWWYTVLRPTVMAGMHNHWVSRRCHTCCRKFKSRNLLFKHLRDNKDHAF